MFNFLKQRCGPKICSLIPLDIWHRILEVDLVLPHWHVVSDQELSHISGLYKYRNIRQFKADIEYFLQYYTPVNLQDVINYLDGFGSLPKRCFLPTFDDGFSEIYNVIGPILQVYGVPAVFFLITSAIDNRELCYPHKKSLLVHALTTIDSSPAESEASRHLTNAGFKYGDMTSRVLSIYYKQRHVLDELELILGCDFASYVSSVQPYLTSVQIKDLMKMGFDIGAHTIDHPLFSELTLEEQLVQTTESQKWLSTKFQYNCQSFAFPYKDAGILINFFHQAFSNGLLKVSFGTGGLQHHFFPRNLPRFTMERTDLPAKQILSRQFGRSLFKYYYDS